MDEKVQKVLDYIEEHKEEYLELLLRFCRQPSIAATGEGIEKMAGMVVDELKKRVPNLPPVRINTNGHANLIHGRDVIPELKGRIDTLSISLNANNAADYTALCHPVQGEAAYQAMLDFAKEAKDYVPHVIFTVVDKGTAPEEIEESRRIAESLGVHLRVRSYIDS